MKINPNNHKGIIVAGVFVLNDIITLAEINEFQAKCLYADTAFHLNRILRHFEKNGIDKDFFDVLAETAQETQIRTREKFLKDYPVKN